MEYFDEIAFIGYNRTREFPWGRHDRVWDFYAINYLSDGVMEWIDSEDKLHVFSSPCLFWTLPGNRNRYGPHNNSRWDNRWTSFSGPAADRMFSLGLIPNEVNSPCVQVFDPPRLRDDFDQLLRYLPEMPSGIDRALLMLESVLLHIHEQQPVMKAVSGHHKALHQLAASVSDTPTAQWDFHEESRKMCVSYSHFRRLFKQACGVSPHRFVLAERLKLAASHLREGQIPVKECSFRAGFEDIYYFTRLFKQRYGVAPGKYSKRFLL